MFLQSKKGKIIAILIIFFILLFGGWATTGAYLFASGEKAIAEKRYADAEKYLSWTVRLVPWDGKYHAWLGYALQNQGRLDEALISYERAIKGDYLESRVWNNRGYIYHQKALAAAEAGDSEKQQEYAKIAEESLNKAIERNPTLSSAHLYLGEVYFQHYKNYPLAIASYVRVYALDPEDWFSLARIGSSYALLENYPLSLEYFERSLEIHQSAYAYNGIGWLYGYELGDEKKAVEMFEKSISLDPNYAPPYGNSAVIHKRLGETAKANELYQKYFELRGGQPSNFIQGEIQGL